MDIQIQLAVQTLKNGGLIAYPTEYCFGFGCDPDNQYAVQRIVEIKQRLVDQGLLLIASNQQQVDDYAEFSKVRHKEKIKESWPGAVTWVLPAKSKVPHWIKGKHQGVAMRMTAHPVSRQLCEAFSKAIVSTSANRSGCPPILDVAELKKEFVGEVDFILDAKLGNQRAPSKIFCDETGKQLR